MLKFTIPSARSSGAPVKYVWTTRAALPDHLFENKKQTKTIKNAVDNLRLFIYLETRGSDFGLFYEGRHVTQNKNEAKEASNTTTENTRFTEFKGGQHVTSRERKITKT